MKLPGVKETAEEVAQDPGQGEGPNALAGAGAVPNQTPEGLVEGAVAPLPSSAAPPGADLLMKWAHMTLVMGAG